METCFKNQFSTALTLNISCSPLIRAAPAFNKLTQTTNLQGIEKVWKIIFKNVWEPWY